MDLTSEDRNAITTKLMVASEKMYQQQFGNDQFYVVILSDYPTKIISDLKEAGLKIIDFSGLIKGEAYKLHVQDSHPNQKATALIAQQLLEYINK